MRKLFAGWIEALKHVLQARVDREVLARLDARTLRDIGIEAWNSELAQRTDRQRERSLMRLAASRFGAY